MKMNFNPQQLTERASALGHLMSGAERWFTKTDVSKLSKSDKAIFDKKQSGKTLTDREDGIYKTIKKRLNDEVQPELSEGAKTHLENRFYGMFFDFQKSVNSFAMTKGNLVEERAIKQLGELLGYKFAFKNERHFENDWIHGTPDWLPPAYVFDTKCVWEPSGLKIFDKSDKKSEDLNRLYTWQIKAYCWLTERNSGAIVRVLMSLPESQLLPIAKSHWIDAGGTWRDEIPKSFLNEVRDMYDFEAKAKIEDRVSLRRVDLLDKDIDRMKAAVELSRDYIQVLIDNFNSKNINELKYFSK